MDAPGEQAFEGWWKSSGLIPYSWLMENPDNFKDAIRRVWDTAWTEAARRAWDKAIKIVEGCDGCGCYDADCDHGGQDTMRETIAAALRVGKDA